ncbi:YdeI/OmpD-associated family protein [Armatimonas sp.]|uniref:YdeI/OmpD-associated family protein n=1 Tax=Armatimonas sp. TaxID=1872638 RepID=UPI00286A4024|nr:YdeI/OmpD-associated family protein [Armatimonas sp.]
MSTWIVVPNIGPGPHEAVYPPDRTAWRAWLEAHHVTAKGVWLVYYKKGSGMPSIAYPDMVKECLCFGWIDSRVSKLDEARYLQLITPRKPKSVWSKINKGYIEELERENLLTHAGIAKIEAAKADGSWTSLDAVEALTIPDDLAAALAANPAAQATFATYSPSTLKLALTKLAAAKRPETRQRRLDEIIALAAEGKKQVP